MCLLAGESLISTSAHLSNGKSTSTSTTARIETLPHVFYTRHIVNQVVGLVACACAVTYCFKWSSGVVDVNNDVDVDYLVLLVATGLVAFDLWSWSSSLSLSWSSLNESALTLAFFLVALTLAWYKCNYELLPNCYQHQYQFYLKVWMAYRVARLALSSASASTATATTQPTTAMKSPPPLEATRKVVKAVVAQPIDDSSSSIKSEDLWTIHGVQYDLADFVNKHPGGKETILLGQGRDCTALFESYHPFTNKHRVVLNKFQPVTAHVPAAKNVSATKNVNHKQQQQQQQPKSTMAASVVDPFYDILKKRTSERLREHGLDPELDRGASYGRVAHYLLIFTCLLASAVYHFKVRTVLQYTALQLYCNALF